MAGAVTVVVATFGGTEWQDLARERAIPSVERLGWRYVHVHRDTLHEARNAGLDQVDTPWAVHLDADDELEASYANIPYVAEQLGADLVGPAVRYVLPGWQLMGAQIPKVPGHAHMCHGDCLRDGNWLVVGSLVRPELVRSVGGWRDWPIYEDWDLWARCALAGANINCTPNAVYRAHARPGSRNRAPDDAFKDQCHRAIQADVFGGLTTS